MAIDMIENEVELSALAPMRQSIFVNDNVSNIRSRLGYAPERETEFEGFLGMFEGNRKKGKAIKAKNVPATFPFNANMTCVQLADVAEKVNAEIDATTLEGGTGSAFLKKSYAEYLGKLKRHKNSIDALIRVKKCDSQMDALETEKLIAENAAAVQAAQQAAMLPSAASGNKNNTMLYIFGGLAFAGFAVFMILRKKPA